MDSLVDLLMHKYGLSKEQAIAYAAKVRGSDSQDDIRLRTEALGETIQPTIDRAKRIAYYNDVYDRFQRGDEITDDELTYLQQVQAQQAKQMQSQAAAMIAAKRLVNVASPAVSGLMAKIPQPGGPAPTPAPSLSPAQIQDIESNEDTLLRSPEPVGLDIGPVKVMTPVSLDVGPAKRLNSAYQARARKK